MIVGTKTTTTIALSLAKEAEDSIGANKAYFNRKSGKTNIAVVYLQEWTGFVLRCNSYTMDIDRGRNCYNCREFGHLVRNCRN